MNTRSRFVRAIAAISTVVAITACADKVFRPSLAGSPRMVLQFSATGAKQVNAAGKPQVIVGAAVYFSNVLDDKGDSTRFLARPMIVPVSSGSAQFTINVDLTGCLSDATRKGSQSACSLYYGVALHDSTGFNSDTSDFFKGAYDYAVVGPIDVSPGKPPALAPLTLSNSRFAIHEFDGDEALRLGGPQTPVFFSGPISGSTAGLAPSTAPVLFALTNGFQITSSCASNQNNCVTNGFQAAQLAIFRGGTWSRVSGPQNVNQFTDVAAFSPTDVYIASQNGLFHYDGTAITQVSGVTGGSVASLGIAQSGGSKYVIAGMQNGSTWIGNTTTWTQYPMPANSATINNVCITGPNEAFASSTNNGGLYRFNGSAWNQVLSTFTQPKVDLQCPAPGQAFVGVQNTATLSWNGSGWTQLPLAGRPVRIAVVSPTEIYGAGDSAGVNRNYYRYDGTSWRLLATSQYTQNLQYRPWADPRGGAAYFGSVTLGRIDQVTSAGVHPVSYGPSIRDAIMTSANNAFVVGLNMFLARYNGATWTVDAPPAGTSTARIMNGVWSNGQSNAWAVGGFSTIIHWDGTKWIAASDSAHPAATRDGYNAVWGSGGSVWIAGNSSIVRCTAVTSCANDPVTGIDSLFGIWGTSATNAWAVGAHGKILHFDGTQWTSVATPTSFRLSRVWGSSATDVWAVGDTALVHYDGTSWKVPASAVDLLGNNQPQQQQPSIVDFQLGLFGFGPNDLYAATARGGVQRWSGFEWDDVPLSNNGGGRVVAISGYPGGCGIAVIDVLLSGNIASLLRGVGPTGLCSTPMTVTTPWP